MGKRLLDYDPDSGKVQYFEYDPATKKTTISSYQDCTHFVELNKSRQNQDGYWKHGVKNEWAHIATIPDIIIEKWLKEENLNVFKKEDWPRLRKKLQDPDWRYLKTFTGKI